MNLQVEEKSVKINIAGKNYPVTVKDSDLNSLQKAAEMIEIEINEILKTYPVKDKQDLLAMCCIQIALKHLKSSQPVNQVNPLKNELESIENNLSSYLQKINVL